MANTYQLIASRTLTNSTTTEAIFTAVAGVSYLNFTDFLIKVSARSTQANVTTSMRLQLANANSLGHTSLLGDGTTASSTRTSGVISSLVLNIPISGANATANTFGITEVYIPSATILTGNNDAIPISIISASENNATAAEIRAQAVLISTLGGDALTTTNIRFSVATGAFASGSTFWLYGIKNS
jgi:hypothetical protein